MAWRDQLRTASFRGVSFYVEEHEASGGRRSVTHEYPYRDVPYTEDMGRAARRWQITAYILGAEYMDARDRLIDALETKGSGQLIHPYLGTKTANMDGNYSLRESSREGGYCSISFTLVEAGTKSYPNATPIPSVLTALGADDLISVSKDIFDSGIGLDGVTEFVRTAYAEGLSSVAGIFDDIQLAGGINLQSTISRINQAADWATSLAELRFPSLSLIQNITGVSDRVVSLFKGLLDLNDNSSDAAKNLSNFSNFTTTKSPSNTGQSAIINQNAEVTERFVQSVALASESKALVLQTYPSYEEALETRDYILKRIDAVALTSQNDSEYDALQNLRKQVGAAIPSLNKTLPRLGTIILSQDSPALVVSYDLYNSVDFETDLVDRNNIKHPGFMPGGQELEILKDA